MHCSALRFANILILSRSLSFSFAPSLSHTYVQYPVIISIEMHCSALYQAKMALIVTQVCGDSLYLYDPDRYGVLQCVVVCCSVV